MNAAGGEVIVGGEQCVIIGLRPGSNGLRSDKRRKNVPQNNNQFVVNVRALTEHSAAAVRNTKQSAFEVSPRRHRHHSVSSYQRRQVD